MSQSKPEKLALGIRETAYALSVSPNHVRNLIQRGQLKSVRIGRRVLVTMESIKALLSASPAPEALLAETPSTLKMNGKIKAGNGFQASLSK